ARLRTTHRPSPRLPPVTTTLRMTSQFASGTDIQVINEPDCRRNLMLSQSIAADLQDLPLEFGGRDRRTAAVWLYFENHVSDDDRTSNRTPAGAEGRHADCGVAVDHRLYFLGMDF